MVVLSFYNQFHMTNILLPVAAKSSLLFLSLACMAYADLDGMLNRPACRQAVAMRTHLTKLIASAISSGETTALSTINIAAAAGLASVVNVSSNIYHSFLGVCERRPLVIHQERGLIHRHVDLELTRPVVLRLGSRIRGKPTHHCYRSRPL